MNLLLLEEADRVHGDTFRVRGTRATHVRVTLRAGAGDLLTVGLLEGPQGKGRILELREDELVLACTWDGIIPPRAKVDVAIAIPRPKMLRRILFAAAELGVDNVVFFRSWRVERSYLESQALTEAACLPHLREGLMQGRGTRLPSVHFARTFQGFLEDHLPRLSTPRFVLHPSTGPWLRSIAKGEGTLVLGPEGGFIPPELESLTAAGCAPVSLGARILRLETALVYGLAALGCSEHQEPVTA